MRAGRGRMPSGGARDGAPRACQTTTTTQRGVMNVIDIQVPDIGDFADVEIIEILVRATTSASSRASSRWSPTRRPWRSPSPVAGKLQELRVKVGDKVSKGTVIGTASPAGADKGEAAGAPAQEAAPAPDPKRPAAPPAAQPAPAAGGTAKSNQEGGEGDVQGAGGHAGGGITEVRVPDIGDFTEVEVIEVLVAQGDTVELEQSLITVESDKASMEIPSSIAGTVAKLLVKVGDKVAQGTPIAQIESGGAGAAAAQRAPAAAPASAATPAAGAPRSSPQAAPAPAGKSPPAGAPSREHPVPADMREGKVAMKPHASPSVRLFARELGVDLAQVKGTGPKEADHCRRRARVRQAGHRPVFCCSGWRCRRGADGSRRSRAGPDPLAEGRLREIRRDRGQAPVTHQEDRECQPAPQLGDDPARHQPRRCGHHRTRGLPPHAECGEREGRNQADDARLPGQGVHRGVEEVPGVQHLARREVARLQALLPHRVRSRHAEWPGGPGHQGCRQEGPVRHCRGNGGARRQGTRRQTRPCGHARRHLLDLQPSAASAAPTSRRSSTRRRSLSWASAGPRGGRSGTSPRAPSNLG